MGNERRPLRLPVLLLAGTVAALPGAVLAASRPSITLELTSEDGTRLPPVDVSDISVNLMRTLPSPRKPGDSDTADKGDETQDQLSVTLDTSALSNAALVGWVGKGAAGSTVQVKVTVPGGDATYVLTGITTWALSASHSTNNGYGQVSLSIGSKHMTVNGVTVN